MPLYSITRPFCKLSVTCASALALFATSTVVKVQADDFSHDIAFTFNLSPKDHSSDWDGGKSGHDSIDFSFNKWGGTYAGFDGQSFSDWGWDKGRQHDDFYAFTWKDKDGKHDSGWQGFGDCPPPDQSGWNGNQGGKGCSGGNGDPNGGGGSLAAPEPGAGYLSFIAAGAMALLLGGRGFRKLAPAKRS